MTVENGKLHKLEDFKCDSAHKDGETDKESTVMTGIADTQKDMSKVAMIVSLLAVVLLVIFFFGMNRNIAGLTDEVKSLGALRDDVANLDQRMVQMESDLPDQMKRMIALDMVNEMTMKSVYLSDSFQDAGLRAKMQAVISGLKDIRTGLED